MIGSFQQAAVTDPKTPKKNEQDKETKSSTDIWQE
jgi:hypothetical protein